MKGVHIKVRSFILFWKDELTSNKLMLNSFIISRDVRANHTEREMLEFDRVNKSRQICTVIFTFLISWFLYRTTLVPFGANPYLWTSDEIDVTPLTEKSKGGIGHLRIADKIQTKTHCQRFKIHKGINRRHWCTATLPNVQKLTIVPQKEWKKQIKPIKHCHKLILYQRLKIFEAFLFSFKSWITTSKHITLIFFVKAHITRICC